MPSSRPTRSKQRSKELPDNSKSKFTLQSFVRAFPSAPELTYFQPGLLGPDKKVRYAIVGLGDIAQEAMLPGVEHTGNSEVTAFVSSNPEKARELGKQYGITSCYSYEQFGDLLKSGTIVAIYLATPNWRHAEFIIPALRAGIHVLAEKPLEVNTAKCKEIIEAQRNWSAKLMVAYRLHFEPAT